MTALARWPTIDANALGRSLSVLTCMYRRAIPRRFAASSAAFKLASFNEDGSTIPPMREGRGETSAMSSTCFPVGMAGRESSKPEQFSTLNRPETYLPPAPTYISDGETIPAWRSRRWHQVCDGIARRKNLEEF